MGYAAGMATTQRIRTVLSEQQKADAAVRVLSALLSNPEVSRHLTLIPSQLDTRRTQQLTKVFTHTRKNTVRRGCVRTPRRHLP